MPSFLEREHRGGDSPLSPSPFCRLQPANSDYTSRHSCLHTPHPSHTHTSTGRAAAVIAPSKQHHSQARLALGDASIAVVSSSRTRPNRKARTSSASGPPAASVAAPRAVQHEEMPLQAVTHAGACHDHGKEAEEEEEREKEQHGQDREGEEERKEEKGEMEVEQEEAEGMDGRKEGAGCLESLANEVERLQIGIASPVGSGGWGGGGGGWGGRRNVAEQGNDRGWEEGRREERQPQPSLESVTSNLVNPQPSPCKACPPVVRHARHSPSASALVSVPGGKGVPHAMPFAAPSPPSAFSPSSLLAHHRADGPMADAFLPTSFQRMPRDLKTGRRVCFYFNSTTCAAGAKCTFLHIKVDSSLITPGTFYKPVSTSLTSSSPTGPPPPPPPSVPAFFVPVVHHSQQQQYYYHHLVPSLALPHPPLGGKKGHQHHQQQQLHQHHPQQQQQYDREVVYKQAGHTSPLALPRHPHAVSPPFPVALLPSGEAASPPFPAELPPPYRPYGPASASLKIPTYVMYYQYPPSYPPSFSPSLPPCFPPHFHGGAPEEGGEGRWENGWDDAQMYHHQMQQEQQALGRKEGGWEGGVAEDVEGDVRTYHHPHGHNHELHHQHQHQHQHQQQRQPRRQQQQQYQRH